MFHRRPTSQKLALSSSISFPRCGHLSLGDFWTSLFPFSHPYALSSPIPRFLIAWLETSKGLYFPLPRLLSLHLYDPSGRVKIARDSMFFLPCPPLSFRVASHNLPAGSLFFTSSPPFSATQPPQPPPPPPQQHPR